LRANEEHICTVSGWSEKKRERKRERIMAGRQAGRKSSIS
jgi:hypothetical protein